MAQFYADSQHAVKARDHARRAMELAPAQYNDQGQRLIRELTVFQFGCWSVFSKERR